MNRRDFLKLSGVILANTIFIPQCRNGGKKIEGFGGNTTGGKGGRTIWVDNSDDLRYACELSEPRIIRFAQCGNYELTSPIEIYNGNLTLDGSDIPTCIKGRGIRLFASNVIFKDLRIRPGAGYQSDGLEITNSWDVLVDHCSISWSIDELFQVTGGGGITVQWCIFSEPLRDAGHPKGEHGYGPWANNNVQGLTMHHNLVAHCQGRIPDIYGGKVDLRNHLVYNPGWTRMNFLSMDADLFMNAVNTQYIPGLDTPDINNCKMSMTVESGEGFEPRIYLKGNRCPWRTSDSQDERDCVYDWQRKPDEFFVGNEFDYPVVKTHSIEEAYELILGKAGAQPRDIIDKRIVNDVRNGTGKIIDDPFEVGGWPDLTQLDNRNERVLKKLYPGVYELNQELGDLVVRMPPAPYATWLKDVEEGL